MSDPQNYNQEQRAPELPETVIPWWQDGSTTSEEIKEPHFLSKGVFAFFQMVWGWFLFPLRQMDESEQEMFNSMANEFHQRFIDKIRGSRHVPVGSQAFDGRVVSGMTAQTLGLVDEIGYLDDALDVARQMATLPSDASAVMLRRDNDRAYTLLDVTPNTPTPLLPINIPGFDRSKLPMFLYMWQPDPGLAART